MGLLNRTKRVELEGGDWVEVRPLSIGALRTMRQQVAGIEPPDGEGKDEAQGYELQRLALEACIVAWSDDAPVTPDNISLLPYEVSFKVSAAVGLGGSEELPLDTGPTSTAVSAEPAE